MKRRNLAGLLALAMLLSLFPTAALAGKTETEPVYELIDLGTTETSADPSPGISLFSSENNTVDLTGTGIVNWIDRVDLPVEVDAFYNALVSASDNTGGDDWLIDPTTTTGTTTLDNISVQVDRSTTKTATYTCVKVTTVSSDQTEYMKKCIRAAYDAFDRDHPEVFWLTGNTSILTSASSSDGTTTFYFALYGVEKDTDSVLYDIRDTSTYQTANAIKETIKKRNDSVSTIMGSSYPSAGTNAEKVAYFDSWLTANNEYNTSVSGGSSSSAPKSAWECISALEGRTGANGPVCEGYARAMKVLCDKANIPCVLVDGNASADSNEGGAHMWNYVQIGDTWYGVDTTWNDPTGGSTSGAQSGNENQNYLLVGSSTPNTHNKTFIESHPVANRASNGGVEFTNGPKLSKTALVKNISATAPTKTTYNVSDVFEPDGMTLTATYWYTTTTNTQATSKISDNYETAGVTWEPKTFSSTSDTTVTITYGGQTVQQTVTVNDVSSALTIDSNINNGSITASVDGAAVSGAVNSGKIVTLTVTPNANYELVADSLKVTDTNGTQTVPVTSNSDNTYTFTMPAYAVTVTAQFRQQTTAAPTFTSNEDALASVDDKEATFTLTSTPVDTYKIYNDATGETIVSAVTATANGSTLTLTFTTAPTTDITYYISAIESGKIESPRTAVTVHPYTKSNNATLSNLTITGGTLSPAFDSGTTQYTVEVPYSVASVTVTPTVTDSKASVTVNSQTVTSGSASDAISLIAGQETSITVKVTAENGTTQDYTITVTRAAAQYEIELSKTGIHPFPSLVAGYEGSDLTPLTVTVTNTGDVDTGGLTVALSGTNTNSFILTDTSLSSIAVGNTATFTVKPNTGLPQGTYTATVTVSGSNGIGAAFDISFTVAASQNEANVKYAIATIKAAPMETWSVSQAACESSSIINELKDILTELMESHSLKFGFKRIKVYDIDGATAGTAGNPQGTNGTYNFTLTASGGAADASDYYTEEVTITGCPIIATPYPVRDDATLSDLILSEGTLAPAFSSGVYTYTATVPDTTGSITITPTTNNSKASVTVNGKTASQPVPLTIGDTKISVVVTAEDGTTTQTYTIIVTRLQPEYFTITFDANGGSVSPANAATTASGTLISLPTPVRSGYRFDGWYSMLTGGNRVDPSTVFDSDSTIYAHWTYIGSGSGGSGSSGGSSTSGNTTSETTKNPDGSTTTTVTNTTTGTVTETTKNPDGSQKVVTTQKDGTVTTTTTDTAGNKTEVMEKDDGSTQTTVDNKDGSSSVTKVDGNGQTESTVTLPTAVVESAQEKGEPVSLPMPSVPVITDRETAPTVTVTLPNGTSAKVEIPVAEVTPGTVAVIVKADGTEEVIKTSLTTENGVAVTLSDGDTVKIVDNSKTFDDVSDTYWGAEAVAFASSRELFAGTSATTFSPDAAMNRAMIVTVLARFEGVDTSTGDNWYDAGAQWAVEAGISDGTNLDQNLSREQLATMLWRYAGEPVPTASLDAYGDAASVSSYAQQAMAWAVETGLIQGVTDDTIRPQGQATRAQVSTILQRFIEASN